MFTGLVQDIGTIEKLEQMEQGVRVHILTSSLDLTCGKIGASIACSGVCLTATAIDGPRFIVEVSCESLSKTHIGDWRDGDRINLEPSLRMGDELGGHFVFGHVDGLVEIVRITEEGESFRVALKPPANLMKYIASKGSVTLDGVSLTVNEVGDNTFGVNIIPHTWTHTTFGDRKAGDFMHIEVDMLARYVERMVGEK